MGNMSLAERTAFLSELDRMLNDPGARLSVPSSLLLDQIARDQIHEGLKRSLPEKPKKMAQLGTVLTYLGSSSGPRHPFDIMPSGAAMALWNGMLTHTIENYRYERHRAEVVAILSSFQLHRDVSTLKDSEKALLRAMSVLYADNRISPQQWGDFLSLMVWGQGTAILRLPKDLAQHKRVPEARALFGQVLQANLDGHQQFMAEAMHLVAQHRNEENRLGTAINEALSQGARWLTRADLATSRVYARQATPAALTIGYMKENGEPVCYDGDASLITIAAPGTGKTQGQVIPNLLSYPGSVFVLDVKGELWATTAAHRQRHYGPVYRFSPTDRGGRSHRYNPFDVVAPDPVEAANACQVLAAQLVPSNPHARDPYWENRARDFIWAFAMLVALDTPPEQRNLLALSSYLSVPTNYEDNIEGISGSGADVLIKRMENLAERAFMPELRNTAAAFRDGLIGTRLSSVFDTARMQLSALARTPTAASATSISDWHPLDLRRRPGTSIYLTLRPGEIQAYAGIIRLIFQQHADVLTRDFAHDGRRLPVTFFLDELPQLGFLSSLNDLLDVGRGAGLRLWMFAQYLGQLRSAYAERADGIVGATQVRCFMQPDNDAAQLIQPMLGVTRNMLTGERKPLAETYELTSRIYGDHTIALARNEMPALLVNRFAYQTHSEIIAQPPPVVPVLPMTRRSQ